jgi:3-oxoacyl-[acyl-carrier protein] reductase
VSFAGRVALVTGGGSGIGAGVAAALAAGGATVAVIDIDGDAAARVAGEIGGARVALPMAVDASVAEEVERATRTTVDAFGRIDIAVNAAGIIRNAVPIEETDPAEWDSIVDVNARGPFLVARAVVPHMKSRSYGRIVNIVSRRWLGGAGLSSYAASKGAALSLTRSLAIELGRYGITANAVSPSLVVTPLFLAMPERERHEVLDVVATQPIPRPATVDDVVHAVCFFASEDAGFITGQNLYVAGGRELDSSGVT